MSGTSLTLRCGCRHLKQSNIRQEFSHHLLYFMYPHCCYLNTETIARSIHTHKFLYTLRGEKSYFKIPIDKF